MVHRMTTDGPDPAPAWRGGLPSQWPSAWPSLGRRVAVASVVPIVVALVALAVVAIVGVLPSAWWVPLIPLVLLVGPLTLPGRVRSAMQGASDAKTLVVTVAPLGLLVRTPAPARLVRPSAEVTSAGRVRYSLR